MSRKNDTTLNVATIKIAICYRMKAHGCWRNETRVADEIYHLVIF